MSSKARVLVVLSWVVGGCADDVSESMVSLDSSSSGPDSTSTVTVTTTDMTADTSTGTVTQTATTDMPTTTDATDTDATTSTGSTSTDPTTGTDSTGASESSSTTEPTTSTDSSSSSDGSTTTDATTTDATESSSGGGPECMDDAECDDLTACTLDQCVDGSCQSTPQDGVPAPIELQQDGDCNVVMCTMGMVSDEIDDADVPVDDDACTQDLCMGGIGSNPPTDAGTDCPDGVCDGMGVCVECLAPDDCTQLPADDECQTRTCIMNACGQSFADPGTPLSAQQDGDCLEVVCDGSGGSGPQDDDADPFDDGLECTADTCEAGVPVNDPLPAGTDCAAGVCDGTGGCVGCLSPADCSGTDTFCQTITCELGTCGVDNTAAGTDLPAADQTVACQLLECDGTGGVQGTPLAENTDCNDGLFCNGGDLCDAVGSCTHGGSPCGVDEVCDEPTDTCQPE